MKWNSNLNPFQLLYQIYHATRLKAPPPFEPKKRKSVLPPAISKSHVFQIAPPPIYRTILPPTFWYPQTRVIKKILYNIIVKKTLSNCLPWQLYILWVSMTHRVKISSPIGVSKNVKLPNRNLNFGTTVLWNVLYFPRQNSLRNPANIRIFGSLKHRGGHL